MAASLAVLLAAGPSPVSGVTPAFKLPFICGQTYTGTTRAGHGWAVDFNQLNNADAGDPVIASAAGTVTSTKYAASNGQITISHPGGWKTTYAHMSRIAVKLNQAVARSRLLGFVDDVGNATSDHLHYEQLYNGVRVQARFDGIRYRYGSAIRSTNCDDKTAPARSAPNPGFPLGYSLQATGATVPLRNSWTVVDSLSGVRSSVLERSTNDGAFGVLYWSTYLSAPSFTSYVTPGDSLRRTFRVRAFDNAGNGSTYAYGPSLTVRVVEEDAGEVTYQGDGWNTLSATSRSGAAARTTTTAGHSATLAQAGHDFAIVAYKGPDRGRFQVYLDGVPGSVVDLYSASPVYRQVVWTASQGVSAARSIEVRALGQKSAASTASTVELDAFLVLQAA